MRGHVAGVLAAALLGSCGTSDSPATPPFATPVRITASAGERLVDVARRNRVLVADLASWNGLVGSELESDTTLLIWDDPGRAEILALMEVWRHPGGPP